MWELYAKDVDDEAFVVDYMLGPFREEFLFVEGIEYGCRGWGWWDAHSGTEDLLPVCITELDEIIPEDYVEGFDERVQSVVVECSVFISA